MSDVLDLTGISLPLTAAALFGSPCPLEVEFGVGKGRFIVEWGAAHPERGILGVERSGKYARVAAARAARRGVSNVRIVRSTAEDLLFRCLSPASVAAIHVYYPDPWPKRRHAKRRLFKPENLARMVEVLGPGGMLLVKTDHDEYGELISLLLTAHAELERLSEEEFFANVPASSFEGKYDREGRSVHRFACRRSGLDGALEGR